MYRLFCFFKLFPMVGKELRDILYIEVFFSARAGVFWIDWKSLREYYDVVYMNWRPEMFRHKSTIHE